MERCKFLPVVVSVLAMSSFPNLACLLPLVAGTLLTVGLPSLAEVAPAPALDIPALMQVH
jgi:hypothetical protein